MNPLNRKRRSKMEVYLDILKAISDGEEKPTRIMSRCNITWNQLNEGVDLLLSTGFIMVEVNKKQATRRVDRRTKNKYYLTPKGESVIKYFRKELGQFNILIAAI
jgi:predicted transcriptional regulator